MLQKIELVTAVWVFYSLGCIWADRKSAQRKKRQAIFRKIRQDYTQLLSSAECSFDWAGQAASIASSFTEGIASYWPKTIQGKEVDKIKTSMADLESSLNELRSANADFVLISKHVTINNRRVNHQFPIYLCDVCEDYKKLLQHQNDIAIRYVIFKD